MQADGFRRALGAGVGVRQVVPLGLGAVCLWLVARQVGPLDIGALAAALASVTPSQWLAAGLATAISFAAIGQYDVVMHRHMGTGLHPEDAQRAGMAAIALGQMLGMGVVIGALVRWRLIAPLSAARAVQMSVLVAVSFLAAWAVVAGLVVALVLPQVPVWTVTVWGLALAGAVWGLLRYPQIRMGGRSIAWPSLPAAAALVLLAAVDTAAAAVALHVLIPPELSPDFALLFAAYLLALGAALVSGTPGGVGPFELVLLGLLAQIPQPDLIAAIVAFRLVYYALPAVLAACALWRPAAVRLSAQAASRVAIPGAQPRSEIGVIAQTRAGVLETRRAAGAVLALPQAEVLLFGATRGHAGDLLTALKARARSANRVACLYKIDARDALAARRAGWRVLRIAQDAVLDPARHDSTGPAHRQLRRVLRKAQTAGVEVFEPAHLPLAQMARVNADWAARHGGENGLSMGRFAPDYLRGQRVFCAFQGRRLVAFMSFHAARGDWCLDLMRTDAAAPAGTGHLIIETALRTARREGMGKLSLASVPVAGSGARRHGGPGPDRTGADRSGAGRFWLTRLGLARLGLGRLGRSRAGLRRFKESFGPRWQPLYIAAPGWGALALAAADLWRGVHHPPDLPGGAPHPLHDDDEHYEFASNGDLWDMAKPNPAATGPKPWQD